jgi:hypothetical protein
MLTFIGVNGFSDLWMLIPIEKHLMDLLESIFRATFPMVPQSLFSRFFSSLSNTVFVTLMMIGCVNTFSWSFAFFLGIFAGLYPYSGFASSEAKPLASRIAKRFSYTKIHLCLDHAGYNKAPSDSAD